MKRRMSLFVKCVLAPVLLSLITAVAFKPVHNNIGENMLLLVYKNIMPKIYYIGQMIIITSPNTVFCCIFGGYVYRYFKSDGIYEITRYKSRLLFLAKKQLALILCCFVYHLIYCAALFAYVCILTSSGIGPTDIKTALVIFLLSFSVSLIFALASNALSFYLGEHNGFIINGCIIALLCAGALWKKHGTAGAYVYLNPISDCILIWHDSALIEKNDLWELYGIERFLVGYSLSALLGFIAVLFIIIIVSGAKADISVSLKEEL